ARKRRSHLRHCHPGRNTARKRILMDQNMSLRDALRSLLPTTRAQPSDDPHRLLAQFRALMATRTPTPPASGQRPLRVGVASLGAGANHLVVDCLDRKSVV